MGDCALPNVALPLSTLHVPVPVSGDVASRIVVVAQSDWSGPALASLGGSARVMLTVSRLMHSPLVIVHSNVSVPASISETSLLA